MELKYIDNIELKRDLKCIIYDLYNNYDNIDVINNYKKWYDTFKDNVKFYKISAGNKRLFNELELILNK